MSDRATEIPMPDGGEKPTAAALGAGPIHGKPRLRERVAALASTPHAFWAMLGVAVIDASVFPVPPFAILVPMCLAQPRKALRYAIAGTLASITGGLIGYAIGQAVQAGLTRAFEIDVNVRITSFGLDTTVAELLGREFWILAMLASVLPTPYKVVAIGSGMVGVPIERFVLASVIGRSARFFGVALFVAYAGDFVRRYRARTGN